MTATASHLDIFPTRLWSFDLPELAPRQAAWTQAVQALRAQSPEPAGRSNRQGWNSEATLFSRPEFAPLHQACAAAFRDVFKAMQADAKFKRFRLEAWANVHDQGGYNTVHVHPGAQLSGSFYLTLPEGSGAIVFRDPRPGAAMSVIRGAVPNSTSDVKIMPKAGTLLVFPSWLEHGVEAHAGEAPRISIAINAVAG